MNLDDMIRTSLAAHEHDLAGHPDPLAQVTAGVRHRRDTRTAILAGIAVIVIAIAIPLAITGFRGAAAPAGPQPSTSPDSVAPTGTPASGTTDPGAVPWLDLSTAEPAEPTATPLPRARACTAADLAAAATIVTDHTEISGESGVVLSVRNAGTTRCTLSGYPDVFFTAGGHRSARPSAHDEITAGGFVPATVDPGQSALVRVTRTFECDSPLPGTGNSVTANGITWAGKDIRFPTHSFSGACPDFMVSAWYTEPPQEPSFPAYAWDALIASIDASQAHIAAGTLYFTVTLTNPTDAAITLEPCPIYVIDIDAERNWYTLNCAAAPSIPAHRSVRFAMQVDVTGVPGDMVKLGWEIADTPGPLISAGAQIAR